MTFKDKNEFEKLLSKMSIEKIRESLEWNIEYIDDNTINFSNSLPLILKELNLRKQINQELNIN